MHTHPLLLIGSGDQLYREYALAAVARHQPVILLDSAPPTWQSPYLHAWAVADLADTDAVRSAARMLAAEHHVAGVLTWSEYATVAAANVAADLGLPGDTPAAARLCRDKAGTRAALAAARVPSAAHAWVTSYQDALAAAHRIGWPVILKPASHAGSLGVIRVDQAADLRHAWDFTLAAAASQGPEGSHILVEEYLDGPEISLEVVSHAGRHHPVARTRKTLGFPPYFEELAHTVDPVDLHHHPATEVTAAALDALGVTHGVSHVELRLTTRGPAIVEVNKRLGGDFIPHLVQLALGIDLVRAAADLAAGRAPDLTARRHMAATVRFLYPHTAGTVRGITLTPGPWPWLERMVPEQQPGAHVAPPPGGTLNSRLAHLIVTGHDVDQCLLRLAAATHAIRVDLDTAAPVPEEAVR